MTKSTTFVTLLLDRSQSMNAIRESTIAAFNGFVNGLKEERDTEYRFTFLQFDAPGIYGTEIAKVHIQVPIRDVPALVPMAFQPRGNTPLIEAATKTILATELAVAKFDVAPKVIICIQTDGEENCSAVGYTWERLRALIATKQELGWQFNFLGAGINAYKQGAQMGIQAESTMSYESASPEMTARAFYSTATVANNFAGGRAATTNYSKNMRSSAGDRFAPAGLADPLVGLAATGAALPLASGTVRGGLDLTTATVPPVADAGLDLSA